jgi:hypothetical protein
LATTEERNKKMQAGKERIMVLEGLVEKKYSRTTES